jgi:hypothetical protein
MGFNPGFKGLNKDFFSRKLGLKLPKNIKSQYFFPYDNYSLHAFRLLIATKNVCVFSSSLGAITSIYERFGLLNI